MVHVLLCLLWLYTGQWAMDYTCMDLTVRCLRKAVKLNHSLTGQWVELNVLSQRSWDKILLVFFGAASLASCDKKMVEIYPYPSGSLHWHWGNHMIAPVSVKQPWRIWVNASYEATRTDNIGTTKQSTTKPCTYCMEYTAHFFGSELSILLMANNNFDSPGWDSQVWEEFSGFFLISRFFADIEILKSEKNMQSFHVLRIITKNFPGHFWSQTSDWSSPLVWN